MNSPQESIFGDATELVRSETVVTDGEPFTVMFHGTVVERHGLGTALEALDLMRDTHPEIRFQVYGDGDFVERFKEIVTERKLEDRVDYHGYVPLETIAKSIETVDLGLIPNIRSVFTEINLPTRIFEYLSKGKPVIAPRTKGILDYFSDDDILFFEPGDARSLADIIKRAHADAALRRQVVDRGTEIYLKHGWRIESQRWLGIVEDLIGVAPKTRRATSKAPAKA